MDNTLLIKIDTDMEKLMGRILVSKTNQSYMMLLENRRKKHALYPQLIELRAKQLRDYIEIVSSSGER